jgi:hypothetical protein
MQAWRVTFVVFLGGLLPSTALATNGPNMMSLKHSRDRQ